MQQNIPDPPPGFYKHVLAGNPSMSCGYLANGSSRLPNAEPWDSRLGKVYTQEQRQIRMALGMYTLGNRICSWDVLGSGDPDKFAKEMVNNHDYFVIKDKEQNQSLIVSWVDDRSCDRIFGGANDL